MGEHQCGFQRETIWTDNRRYQPRIFGPKLGCAGFDPLLRRFPAFIGYCCACYGRRSLCAADN